MGNQGFGIAGLEAAIGLELDEGSPINIGITGDSNNPIGWSFVFKGPVVEGLIRSDLIQQAYDASKSGDVFKRDELLRQILGDKIYFGESRDTRSLQDARLTLKSFEFAEGIKNGKIKSLDEARSWLVSNLGPQADKPYQEQRYQGGRSWVQ